MERLQVIALAAARLRERAAPDARGLALVRGVCAMAPLDTQADRTGGMLGGAYARLYLFDWENPGEGDLIWYSEELDERALAFAIAHELGHYTLHRGEGVALDAACGPGQINPQDGADDLREGDRHAGLVEEYSPRARREREANAFAAELLMPRAETRRRFVADPTCDVSRLADHFGVSPQLAQRRLIDAVLTADRFSNMESASASAPTAVERVELTDDERQARAESLLARLDDSQRAAATATGPALVVAGPGAGKTATLIGRLAYLTELKHEQPEHILALTFSNRAAGEMRDRLTDAGLRGERLPVMTIHAFAATLLRAYCSRVPHALDEPPLTADFRILDEADNRLLLEELLPQLPLHYYRSIYNPAQNLGTLAIDFSRARDMLLTPADYLAAVDAMQIAPEAPVPIAVGTNGADGSKPTRARKSAPPEPLAPGTYKAKDVAKARERALAYGAWDRALRQRGLMDFGGLILRAVELLRADAAALDEARRRFRSILVDEFQDTNRAAAELLTLLAGNDGAGLWAVGDPNQAIYRWRGADTQNLPRLVARYPHLNVHTLRRCYRSTPDLVRLGVNLAAEMNAPNAINTKNSTSAHLSSLTSPHDPPPQGEGRVGAIPIAPVRHATGTPSVARGEGFASEQHEAAALALTIERQRSQGYAYRDQAILCRTGAQVNAIAQALTILGVPVAESGDFFARDEVKDALAFLTLAAGPDGGGLLRGQALLAALGMPAVSSAELARVTRVFAEHWLPLPLSLTEPESLALTEVSPQTRQALMTLGKVAGDTYHDYERLGVGARLAQFLLRPDGYAWKLAQQAESTLPEGERARAQLSALGELTRLALRFDTRWRNEPGFQAQLLRGVKRISKYRAPIPALPDAREGPPTADVALPGATEVVAASLRAEPTEPDTEPDWDDAPTDAQDQQDWDERGEWAPTVRCFLHYLSALREAKGHIPIVAGQDDAVAVLTIHGSKGLEFPVVYLPYLAKGQFPTHRHGPQIVNPPGFSVMDTEGEREQEDRCLFYVAITRACDQVAFTYGGEKVVRSPLLALLEDDPSYQSAPPLLDADGQALLDERASMLRATLAATQGLPGDDAASSEDETETGGAPLISPAPGVKPEYMLHDLETYGKCPLQYRYAAQYHLRGAKEQATLRFHRYVRGGLADQDDLRERRPNATWAEAQAALAERWRAVRLAGGPHDAVYKRYGDDILRRQWQLRADEAGRPRHALAKQELRAELKQCVVKVTADYLIEEDGIDVGGETREQGAAATAPRRVILERLHTRGPNPKDEDDLALMLYYLAYRQRADVEVRVMIRYLGASLADVDAMSERGEVGQQDADRAILADAAGQSSLVDVTAHVAKDIADYLNPTRKRRSRLDKLDEAAHNIAAGRFAPHPGEERCAACPYNTICPADPDLI